MKVTTELTSEFTDDQSTRELFLFTVVVRGHHEVDPEYKETSPVAMVEVTGETKYG